MQIKTIVRYHVKHIRIAIIKTTSVGEHVGKLVPLYTAGGNINGMENGMEIPQKIKNRTTIQSSNSTSGYIPERLKTET